MADTIFMIHGMWNGPSCWSNYCSIFESKGYRCITATLPYHDMDPKEHPDPRLGTTSLLDYAEALQQEICQLDVKPILMGQTFNEAVYSMLHLLPENEQREAYGKFVYESGRAAFEIGYWLFDSKGASKVDESKITCPVLVVAGTQDRITPASVVRQVARKYKDVSTYKEFKNHAHWVLAEPGWEEVAEYVGVWIKSLGAE
jgi:pimeloyl-ACP methyl ester carboxylesterase